eukprot:172037_1
MSSKKRKLEQTKCSIPPKKKQKLNPKSSDKEEVVVEVEEEVLQDEKVEKVEDVEEEDDNSDYSDYAYDCQDYVTFGEWKDGYIKQGKQKWGVGRCWDFCEFGYCDDPTCRFKHDRFISPNPKVSKVIMHFGKHRGKPLHQIPHSYVKWMANNNVLSGQKDDFVNEMKRIFPNMFS